MSVSVQKQTNLPGHKWQVSCLEFSSNGQYLASGGWDKMVILWDLRTLEPSQQICHHRQPVTCLSFPSRVANLDLLATGSADQTVAIWNPVTAALLRSFHHHSHWILSTCFSPNGKHLASASWDKTISICDVETGQTVTNLTGHTTGVWSCSFNPKDSLGNDTLCSGAEDGSLKLWDLRSKSVVMSMVGGHEDRIKFCSWSPGGQYVASSSADGKLALWEPRSGTALAKIKAYEDCANSVLFYPLITDNSVPLLFSCGGRTCNVWHPFRKHNKQLLSVKLCDSGEEIQALGISPDGSLLATGGSDKDVVLSTVNISLDKVDALPVEQAAGNTNRGTLLWKKYTRKVLEQSQFNGKQSTSPSDQSHNSALLVGMAVNRTEDFEKNQVKKATLPRSHYSPEKLSGSPEVLLQHQRQKLRPKSDYLPAEVYDFENKNTTATATVTDTTAENQLQNARQHLRKVGARKLSDGSTVSSSSGTEVNGHDYGGFGKVNGWNGAQQNGYSSPPVHQGMSPGLQAVDDQTVIVSVDTSNSESEDVNGGYHNIIGNHNYSSARSVSVQPSGRYQPFHVPNDNQIYHSIIPVDDTDSRSVSSSSYYADIDDIAQEMLDLTRQVEDHRF